jgi:hypothetical protein
MVSVAGDAGSIYPTDQEARAHRPVERLALACDRVKRIAEGGDGLVQADGAGLAVPEIEQRAAETVMGCGPVPAAGRTVLSASTARNAETPASIVAGSFRCTPSIWSARPRTRWIFSMAVGV